VQSAILITDIVYQIAFILINVVQHHIIKQQQIIVTLSSACAEPAEALKCEALKNEGTNRKKIGKRHGKQPQAERPHNKLKICASVANPSEAP
jgi:hypothetical protein